MKPNHQGLRVVMAAMVAAALWTGCATNPRVSSERMGDPEDMPVDLTQWHADTHPEYRSGFDLDLPNPSVMPPAIQQRSIINEAAGAGPELLP